MSSADIAGSLSIAGSPSALTSLESQPVLKKTVDKISAIVKNIQPSFEPASSGDCSDLSERPVHLFEQEIGTAKSLCLTKVATIQGDTAICAQIPAGKDQDNCLVAVGVKQKDYSVCTRVTDQSVIDSCRFLAAFENHDVSWCAGIENEQLLGFCTQI